jgi:arylsulfatase A-like enzyme
MRTALMTLVVFTGSAGVAAELTMPPNLVVFISDDHGQRDSTPYGAKDVRTPHLQKLADAGCVFTEAFVASPSCAPSRAALLTGLMPARNGAEANHSFKRNSLVSLPVALQNAGYETAAFGKVAHGAKDSARHGFHHIHKDYSAKVVATFLEKRDGKKPLALFVGTHDPHVPWAKNAGYDPNAIVLPPTFVDTPQTREFRCRYYTEVSTVDRELGALRELTKQHLGESRLFVYTSDHGSQWPFAKWNLYDAGLRVPLVVEWSGVVKPGIRSAAQIQWIDLLPTLIEIGGGTIPDHLDGRSFLTVLKTPATAHRQRIFATHSGDGNYNVTPMRCLRKDGYKLIVNLYPQHLYTTHIDSGPDPDRDGVTYWESWVRAAKTDAQAAAVVKRYRERPPEELYDLTADPHEMSNRVSDPKQADRLISMRRELEAWMAEQGDTQKYFGTPRLLKGEP